MNTCGLSGEGRGEVDFGRLGDSFDPMSTPSHDELVAVLHEFQHHAPVYYWDKFDMWIVSEYAPIDHVLRDAATFSARGKLTAGDDWYSPAVWDTLESTSHRRGGGTAVMGSSDGEDHKRLRDPFKGAFQPRSINSYEGLVAEVCSELLSELRPLGAAEWVSQFGKVLPMRVVLEILGLPRSDAHLLGRWSDSLIDLTTATLGPAAQLEKAQDVAGFEAYMRSAMQERRRQPGKYPGLMDDILSAISSGREQMNDDELVASWTIEMLLGGHETTAAALTTSLWHFLNDRRLWDRLCAEPAVIGGAVEEMLRYEPPTLGLFRQTTVETTIAGTTLPAGARVYWLNYGANHDEKHFNAPDRIDLDRTNASSHLTFGKGVHNCIGAPLARLEMRVAYEQLVSWLPGIRLAPEQGALEYKPSIRLRTPRALHVEWDRSAAGS
jgi:cytochrome P450